jgi:hypothetical protein
MIVSDYSKVALMFFLVSITLFINIDDNLMARIGLSANYGLALVAALVIAMLTMGQKLPFIVLIVILSFIANMPEGFPLNFGLPREVFFGLMVSLVLAPYLERIFDL